ncbi:hypothetical protein [Niastella vici]|nr:hypothetical protein [Niastella vici]
MKNEIRQNVDSTSRLTLSILQKLKNEGFKYVQVKGLTQVGA